MLRELLAWWREQMLALLPGPLTAWIARRGSATAIAMERGRAAAPDAVRIGLRRNGSLRDLGRFPLDEAGLEAARKTLARAPKRGAVVLQVPADAVLERSVTLPLAAERDPPGVLAYEMDRLTPFAADEVYWGWATESRDRANGRLRLRLSLVPKASVRDVLSALERLRLRPEQIEATDRAGEVRTIPLAVPAAARSRLQRVLPRLAAGGCAAMALVALALPFARQQIAQADVEARIDRLKPGVAEAEALRRRIAGSEAGADVIAAERARVGDPLQVLATVTAVLPDDTYLTELQLRRGRLGLSGQSAAAARLIPALAAEPGLKNPAFVAPVTRAASAQADVFSLAADLAPAGGVAMTAALPGGWRGRLLAVGVTVLALACLWIGIGGPLVAWHADRAETLQRREALARRMAEVVEMLPDLRRRAEAARAGAPAAAALLDGGSDAIAGAKLEELVERMAQDAGIGLNRAEMLPVEPRGAYTRIGLRVACAADWAAIVRFLEAIGDASPRMLVDDLQLRGAGPRRGAEAAPVDTALSVFAFRPGAPTRSASQ